MRVVKSPESKLNLDSGLLTLDDLNNQMCNLDAHQLTVIAFSLMHRGFSSSFLTLKIQKPAVAGLHNKTMNFEHLHLVGITHLCF
jgi:hypothetical protein